tara:strand:+ start:2077 stop:3054 length:978 start_codon:yes stop_codon:yes gene_type:complete
MFENTKSFNKLVGFSALSIAGSAAFFSVYGLSKLFAGAQLAVIIMAGSLEFGKLVAASFLYRYWKDINLLHKIYMTVATVILVLITSAGIFGFLSNAYQGATVSFEKETTALLYKEDRLEQLQDDKKFLKEELEAAVAELPDNYRTAKRKLREEYQPKINQINNDIINLKSEVGDLKVQIIETGVEVGPAIYLAKVFDSDVDTVVKFFIFILIFVFDPMAVIFVISYNVTLLDQKNSPKASSNTNITTKKKWWEMFGERKKVEKKLDKPKNDDSDSENFVELEPDIDDLPEVEEIVSIDEETGEETELPVPVLKGGFSRGNKDKK